MCQTLNLSMSIVGTKKASTPSKITHRMDVGWEPEHCYFVLSTLDYNSDELASRICTKNSISGCQNKVSWFADATYHQMTDDEFWTEFFHFKVCLCS